MIHWERGTLLATRHGEARFLGRSNPAQPGHGFSTETAIVGFAPPVAGCQSDDTDLETKPMIKNLHLEGNPFAWAGGPTGVLLIHGYTATTAEVRPLARFLFEHGYSVAGPLLPGHNTRPEDANRYRWQDWVRAVEVGYRELAMRCQRIVVGGESTGALLAIYLAAEHPEIAAVLSYAPALKLTLRKRDVVRLYLAAPFKPYVVKKKPEPAQPSAADSLWRGYPVNPLKGTIELLRLQRAVRLRLPQVRQPVLIVQGRGDQTVHPSAPETIYREVGSTVKELRWFDHSEHKVILDGERDQVFALTLTFVEKALSLKQVGSF